MNSANNPNLLSCPDCNNMVSANAKVCPFCGRPMETLDKEDAVSSLSDDLDFSEPKSKGRKQSVRWYIALVVLVAVLIYVGSFEIPKFQLKSMLKSAL